MLKDTDYEPRPVWMSLATSHGASGRPRGQELSRAHVTRVYRRLSNKQDGPRESLHWRRNPMGR